MARFGLALVDFFFPPRCPFCGASSEDGHRPCPLCLSQIHFSSHPRCPRCGLSFETDLGEDHLCSGCISEERYFARARSIATYGGLMAEVISRFKYRNASYLARPLSALLTEYRDPDFSFSSFDLVLPVPLHPQRLRKRGFNQSNLLARWIGRVHSIPLDFTTLRRIRATQPQTQLSGPERITNIRGAFQVQRPQVVAEKNLLLIDDVFTTGATVQECSKVLLKAGASQVEVLTLVRAV